MLGTHPDYRRLGGGGRARVRWGMERAWKDQVVVTLLAGGAGYPLYKSVGFEDLGAEDARVPGEEEESVSFNVMVYRPPFRELTPGAGSRRRTAEEETAQEETVEDEAAEEETEQEDTVPGVIPTKGGEGRGGVDGRQGRSQEESAQEEGVPGEIGISYAPSRCCS